jgi:hypothetical protein
VSSRLDDPEGLWELGDIREEVKAAWVEWAHQNGFRPSLFLTPTFDESKLGYVSPERATQAWRWFVRHASERMYGRSFRSWCKHAPFSYVVGVDYSKLGAVHLHAVIHGWVELRMAIQLWGARFGILYADVLDHPSAEEERVALAHVVKYATKGSDLISWWFRSGDPDQARDKAGRSRKQVPTANGPSATSGGPCQDQPYFPGWSSRAPGASAQGVRAG